MTFLLLHLRFGLKLDPFCLDIDPGLAFVQNDIYLEGRGWAASCEWQNIGSCERKFVIWQRFALFCFCPVAGSWWGFILLFYNPQANPHSSSLLWTPPVFLTPTVIANPLLKWPHGGFGKVCWLILVPSIHNKHLKVCSYFLTTLKLEGKASVKDDFSTAVLYSCIVVFLSNWLKVDASFCLWKQIQLSWWIAF